MYNHAWHATCPSRFGDLLADYTPTHIVSRAVVCVFRACALEDTLNHQQDMYRINCNTLIIILEKS